MSTEQEINDQINESGKLDPNLAAALLEMEDAKLNGETVPATDTGIVPDTTQAQIPDPNAATPAPTDAELNAENAVVIAKDGKHTIPFEKLSQARDEAKDWKQKYEEQQAHIAAMQQAQPNANLQQNEEQLKTAQALIEASGNDQNVIELFGDFSEEAIAKAVNTLVEQKLGNFNTHVDSIVQQRLGEINQHNQTLTAQEQHFKSIGDTHPDWTSVVESSEFDAWIAKQPSYIQDGINSVLSQGSAQQVNQVLSDYKTQNNLIVNDNAASIKEAAKQAVVNARSQVPNSLSDLPAGSPSAVSREERLASMNGAELVNEMASWTAEQIDAYTSRNA